MAKRSKVSATEQQALDNGTKQPMDGLAREAEMAKAGQTPQQYRDMKAAAAEAMANDAPLPKEFDEPETAPSVVDEVFDKVKKLWYVLTHRAIINGEQYNDDDGEGRYGVVELSEKEVAEQRAHGVALSECKDKAE